ncbi:OFA family MFS transporter [Candidatus Halobonum tyrrellensis]|uniref:Major facilitator superfamily protein n=1 Tax=Candidatus Halobonum tyrrellensis G22 TaxID=1324957 RepID=V4HAY4_9EURY|nr:OFA family MFS transporter [Candidatus Halobonum tyrrellensis]ESP87218.1 major facilitator superfamily protein [Candidatus Halobonum tyrrellensis G22]
MASDAESAGADISARAREELGFSRWWQVAAAAVMMGLVSPYQYVWTVVQQPLGEALSIPLPALGLVFTLFVVIQSGSQFPVGWWRDRHGPRALTLAAGVLAGGGYVGLAYATEVWQIYLLYSLGALGVGIVYTVAVNTALKWFPDRRGLTTGVGTMAFAAGSALFVLPVRANATAEAYGGVFLAMGAVIGVGVIAGALVLRDPPAGWMAEMVDEGGVEETTTGRQYTSREMLRTWQFWLMYAVFVLVSAAGLMLTSLLVQFATEFDLSANITTVSAVVLPIASGVGRLVIGDLSDRYDRRLTMVASFVLSGLGLFLVVWAATGGASLVFVAAVVVSMFFWSPQFSLFPSVVADYYGHEHSSANYALLYSGKMWGGVFGGAVAGWFVLVTSWTTTFLVAGGLTVVSGLASLALRPPER